jgi:anti-anti-sigma factor
MGEGKVIVSKKDKTITVKVIGNFDATTTPVLNGHCERYARDKAINNIVLDFQDVTHIDTSAFACVVGFMQEHLKGGVELYLKNLNEEQKSHIEILKLSEIVKII